MRFDETEWPAQAVGIVRHGVPELLYSEEKVVYFSPTMYYGFDAHYGMWHPPIYLYSLAATAGLFGTGNVAMRATSLAWFLLSLVVVWKIAAILLGKGFPVLLRAVPIALILMTPLLMEGGLMLDIDNTSLCFAILLLLWLYLQDPDTVSPRRLGLLALAFAFALASKLTTPYMLVASIAAYQVLRHQPIRGLVQATVIGVGGSAVFGAAYLAYCALLRYPAGFMVQWSYVGRSAIFLRHHDLTSALHSVHWNLTWISPPIALLIAGALALRTVAFVRARQAQPIDLLLIFCVVGLLAYIPWATVYGKYTVPPVATGVLAAGIELGNRLSTFEKPVFRARELVVAGGAVAAAFLLLLAVPPVQFRPPGIYLSRATPLVQLMASPRNFYLGLTLAAFPLLLFAVWRLLRDRPRSEVWTLAVVAYLLIANPIDVAKLVTTAPGSSPYRAYAEPGFDATVAFLNASLNGNSDEVILAPKDIGFYFDGRYYSLDMAIEVGVGQVGDISRRPEVRYVVDSSPYPVVSGLDGVMRDGSLREIKHIGAFVVYENPGYHGP